MNRFEKFLFLLQAGLTASSYNRYDIVDHLALVFDPNIKTMIVQDEAVPVEFKVKEYLHFLAGDGKRPFWLKTAGE